jgi:ADP-ribose pyrophosphatase
MSYKLHERQVIFEGRKCRLEVHHFVDDVSERKQVREVVVHPGAVIVLPILPDGKLILIRLTRHAVGQVLVELPAGTLEKGEMPLNCAGRELLEETGYLAHRIKPLTSFFTSPGILSEKMHAFVAYDLEKRSQALEEGEDIEIIEKTLDEAMEMIRTGQIVDAKTIVAIMMYERLSPANDRCGFGARWEDANSMGYQDRPYTRETYGGSPGRRFLLWLGYGSVPLFRFAGIDVRAHSTMVIFAFLMLLIGAGKESVWQDRIIGMTAVFLVVLLHEFGHSFTARWVGGSADQIIMHPLGGLALTQPPFRPLAHFLTTAGGPAVNVVICLICGAILYSITGGLPWNPLWTHPYLKFDGWGEVSFYTYWIYQISYFLLVFNLMPIYPLDGGRLVQEVLWPKMGYYRSTILSCNLGMIGATIVAAVGLAIGNFFLLILAAMGIFYCYQMREQMKAQGPYAFETDQTFGESWSTTPSRRNDASDRRAAKRAEKQRRAEAIEQETIDRILAKVSEKGMHSLTWWERRSLKKATENQRSRDASRASRPRQ